MANVNEDFHPSLVVNGTEPGIGITTLADALENAADLGGGTITFASNIENINLDGVLTVADLSVPLVIDGSAVDGGVTFTASAGSRIFSIIAADSDFTLTLKNINLVGRGTSNAEGAAVYVSATGGHTASIHAVNVSVSGFSGKSIVYASGDTALSFANSRISGNTGRDFTIAGSVTLSYLFQVTGQTATSEASSSASVLGAGSSAAPLAASSSASAAPAAPVLSSASSSAFDEEKAAAGVVEGVSATTCFSILGEVASGDVIAPDVSSGMDSGSIVSIDCDEQLVREVTENIAAVEAEAEKANIHVEESLEQLIAGLDLSNANIAKSGLFNDSFDEAVEAMLSLS